MNSETLQAIDRLTELMELPKEELCSQLMAAEARCYVLEAALDQEKELGIDAEGERQLYIKENWELKNKIREYEEEEKTIQAQLIKAAESVGILESKIQEIIN